MSARSRILLTATVLTSTLYAESSAFALQGGEDPSLLPVLVDKRYGMRGAHQLSLAFSTALATKFIETSGVYLTYGYSFTDIIGLELGGGVFFGGESNIMAEVRKEFSTTEPPLSDLYQMVWSAGLDLIVVPLYGKMSFASEVDPAYDLFLVAGGGVSGLKRQVGETGSTSSMQPTFNFGLGFRFYILRMLALRLEFRNYFYPDPEPNPTGVEDTTGTDPLTFNLHFQVGLQFTFGGSR